LLELNFGHGGWWQGEGILLQVGLKRTLTRDLRVTLWGLLRRYACPGGTGKVTI
jgi:hypothetical protein